VHVCTEAGTRSGGARPNQDAFGVAAGVIDPTFTLATLCDGHGVSGHFLARHVRDRLPAWVASCVSDGAVSADGAPPKIVPKGFAQPPPWALKAVGFHELEGSGALQRCGSEAPPPEFPAAASQLAAAFLLLDGDLCNRRSALLDASRVTCEESGCAVVSAMLGGGSLTVASCGDSCAFCARLRAPGRAARLSNPAHAPVAIEEEGKPGAAPYFRAACLSVPHKATGEEAVRLRLQGGRVAAAAVRAGCERWLGAAPS